MYPLPLLKLAIKVCVEQKPPPALPPVFLPPHPEAPTTMAALAAATPRARSGERCYPPKPAPSGVLRLMLRRCIPPVRRYFGVRKGSVQSCGASFLC